MNFAETVAETISPTRLIPELNVVASVASNFDPAGATTTLPFKGRVAVPIPGSRKLLSC